MVDMPSCFLTRHTLTLGIYELSLRASDNKIKVCKDCKHDQSMEAEETHL